MEFLNRTEEKARLDTLLDSPRGEFACLCVWASGLREDAAFARSVIKAGECCLFFGGSERKEFADFSA